MERAPPIDTRWSAADSARCGGPETLAGALSATRARTLALLSAYVESLGPALAVPYSAQLNPPLWEVGHVAWFQDYWVARNRQRDRGIDCDPDHGRPEGRLAGADGLYNSSRVAHASRWELPLPDLANTLGYLEQSLAETLFLLERVDQTESARYFHRLALFHEDMHAEAATYMAQALDIPLPGGLSCEPGPAKAAAAATLHLPGGPWRLGSDGDGFAFDNELPAHGIELAPFRIDAAPVDWGQYLAFVDAGGYRTPGCWSAEGYAWLQGGGLCAPRYLRCMDGQWQQRRFGRWRAIDPGAPAEHLSWYEADAWCRWAGRRLPAEAEWECAAMTVPGFDWGQVWEWTASRFLPFEGFVAHPYRDYSAPWFGTRFVLRGASRATSPRMAHPRYRNFFTPERNDIHAGFRSCAAS